MTTGSKSPDTMPQNRPRSEDAPVAAALAALARIPAARFLLVSASGDRRCGCLVRWVQQCGSTPPMVMVALPKGDPISPVIRDSRHFALGLLGEEDGLLVRLFGDADVEGDPFLGLPLAESPLDMPVPARCEVRLECEMTRHVDIDSDCELYVGTVRRAEITPPTTTSRRRGGTPPGRDEPRSPRTRRDGGEKAAPRRTRARRR